MGYLICDKCGGYYELQPGEKPEDFSDECECGGKLVYSENLEFSREVQHESDDSQGESEINEDKSSYEMVQINEEGTTVETDKTALKTESKRNEIKLAAEVQEILATKGHYIVSGSGLKKSIKILPDGIESVDGQFIGFENIIRIESVSEDENKQGFSSKKTGISGLVVNLQEILAPGKRTLKIILNNGEIELKNIKKRDAERCVSFINRRLN